MSKRAAEIKTSASSYQHNEFIKALIEQQKLVQQQEHEHKQKLQQEQQVHSSRCLRWTSHVFSSLGTRTETSRISVSQTIRNEKTSGRKTLHHRTT